MTKLRGGKGWRCHPLLSVSLGPNFRVFIFKFTFALGSSRIYIKKRECFGFYVRARPDVARKGWTERESKGWHRHPLPPLNRAPWCGGSSPASGGAGDAPGGSLRETLATPQGPLNRSLGGLTLAASWNPRSVMRRAPREVCNFRPFSRDEVAKR